MQIWQNFLASRVAANECHALDAATDDHFLSNMMDVTIRAAQSLKESNPNVAEDVLADRMERDTNEIGTKVKADVATNGCSSERIQQLLKLYQMHSTMKLGA